jgi:nickel/cobalt transporter (NicO) family protein
LTGVAVIAAAVSVLLATVGAPAAAHPLGLPAFARVIATDDGSVTVVWNAAPDDVAALAGSLGADVPVGGVLTREQDAAISGSAVLRQALLDGIVLEQDGRPCPATVTVASLVEQGAHLRFACPSPVAVVALRITLLTELDERYRTLAVVGTTEGAERVMFTSAVPEHRVTLDPDSAELIDLGTPSNPIEADPQASQPFGGSLPFETQFVALIDRSVGLGGLLLGLLIALGVGAAHGLAPGHGKAIAAAYLVGDRGRPRDALLLGGAVALMHTWSVLALGFALYSATQRPVTAALSAWLQLVSGVVVAGLGGWLLWRRLQGRRTRARAAVAPGDHHAHVDSRGHRHDHRHGPDHSHVPADTEAHPLSWQGLVALGAAGGLLPSPSALLVLFTALAVGRMAYGLGLIAMFSVGLAATVSVVGLAVLRGRDVLQGRAAAGGADGRLHTALRAAPLFGAATVAVLGVVVAARAASSVLAASGAG